MEAKKGKHDRYVDWSTKLKNNPQKYKEFKQKDAAKHRIKRQQMSNEQRKVYNEKCKERMRKYRERKKEKGVECSVNKTRQQIKKQRDYWRSKKKEQRSKMSEEQQRAMNEKRKKLYRETKAKKKLEYSTPCSSPNTNAKAKAKFMRIPKKAERFAHAVSELVGNCTPSKQNELNKKGLLLSPKTQQKHSTSVKIVANVKLQLKTLKQSQTARGRQLYYLITKGLVGKHCNDHSIRQALDLKYSYWTRLCHLQEEPIQRVTKVSEETKESIKSFYIGESENLPTKRMATKKFLTETLKTSHSQFLSRNHGSKVSLSTFKKCRPGQVLTMDRNKFQSCLCEYCVNVEFKLEALKKACNAEGLSELKIENKFDCLKMTLCPTELEFNNKPCYERNCAHCGEEYIALHFQPLVNKCEEKTIKWKRWELCSVGSAGKKAKRQMLIEKEGNVLDLLKQLTEEVKPLAKHIFTATWQRRQYQQLISNVPNDCVVTVMDFAENYRCVNQDKVQSAYYNYQQATLFPCVAHYRCPDCSDGIVEESAVFISPDLKHDSHAAHEFMKKMDEHLKETVSFSHEIQYSDGCAAQFKSKTPFQHISEESHHIVERCFFGSRHGKSCCDALGGLVKSQATKYVRSRKGTIPVAKALYDFCKKNLAVESNEKCSHKKRTFFYFEEIHRDSDSTKLLTIPGTRSLHNVKGASPGIVKVRTLACFCPECSSEDDNAKCENEHVVGEWKLCSLQGGKNNGKPKHNGGDERKSQSKIGVKPKRISRRNVPNAKDSKTRTKSDHRI